MLPPLPRLSGEPNDQNDTRLLFDAFDEVSRLGPGAVLGRLELDIALCTFFLSDKERLRLNRDLLLVSANPRYIECPSTLGSLKGSCSVLVVCGLLFLSSSSFLDVIDGHTTL